jgi:hypothetical protein
VRRGAWRAGYPPSMGAVRPHRGEAVAKFDVTKAEGVRNSRGRPCKLTPAMHESLVRAFSLGATVAIACGASGVHIGTFYEWLQQGRDDLEAGQASIFADLAEAVERARHTGDLQLLAAVRGQTQGRRCPTCDGRGAVESREVGGREDDRRHVRCPACKGSTFAVVPDGRLALDLLSRRHPADYSRKDQARVEHVGDGGGPIDVRAIAAAVDLVALDAMQLAAIAWQGEQVATSVSAAARAALPDRAAPPSARDLGAAEAEADIIDAAEAEAEAEAEGAEGAEA